MLRRALLVLVIACRSDDTGPDAPPPFPDGPSSVFPAFTPAVPQIQAASATPRVIAHPVIVPIYFTTDPGQPALDAYLPTLIGSLSWAVLGEYGVGPATVATSVVLTDSQPGTIDVAGAGAFLAGKLDGTHPELGPVDATSLASRVFVISYTSAQLPSCGALRGAVTVGSGVANFVLLPDCMTPDPRRAFAGAGIAAAVTNPLDASGAATGYFGFDAAHAAWTTLGGEIGTACPLGAIGNDLPQVWSNVAAGKYHDPCVPSPEPVYFNSAPVATDDLGARGTGIAVPLGGMATVDVQLFSDDATGPWMVSASDEATTGNTVTFTGPATGENGVVLHLAIAGTQATTTGLLDLASTLDGNSTRWLVPFDVK